MEMSVYQEGFSGSHGHVAVISERRDRFGRVRGVTIGYPLALRLGQLVLYGGVWLKGCLARDMLWRYDCYRLLIWGAWVLTRGGMWPGLR